MGITADVCFRSALGVGGSGAVCRGVKGGDGEEGSGSVRRDDGVCGFGVDVMLDVCVRRGEV